METDTLLTTHDAARWRAALPAHRSVFGSVEFARLQEEYNGLSARLFVWRSGATTVAYPFFLRSVKTLAFATNGSTPAWCDSVTPEFTGPIVSGPLTPSQGRRFSECFEACCAAQGIVAEFAHLHPWRSCEECLHSSSISTEREIVYVDLSLAEEDLWQHSLTKSCRRNVSWSRKAGVRVRWASAPEDVHEFHRIYLLTMDRRNALRRYYFPVEYFLSLCEQLPDQAQIALAEYEGAIAAAALFLHDGEDAYGYLGGADHAFQSVCPTNAAHYASLLRARERGAKRFILGGGYRPNDGIFQYKSSYSPLRANFRVYRQIHLPEAHALLCEKWQRFYGREIDTGGYFPAYRAEPQIIETPKAEARAC